jgi:hypothetical protein
LRRGPLYANLSETEREARRKQTRERIKDGYPHNRTVRKVEIAFRSRKKLAVQKLSEVLDDPSVKDEYPEKLTVNFECGRARLEVELEPSLITGLSQVP